MKYLVIMLIVFVQGCSTFKMPPPCNALDSNHPCGEKIKVNKDMDIS